MSLENEQFPFQPAPKIQAGMTAGALGTEASSLVIGNFVQVAIAAAATKIKLRHATPRDYIFLANDGANTVLLIGTGTDTIDLNAIGGGVAVGAAKRTMLWCVTEGNWTAIAPQDILNPVLP